MVAEPLPGAGIELVDVVKRFGAHSVLRGVTFAVPKGEITVLLGPSGAGKTVTISHVVGLIQPDKGVVRVQGNDLAMLTDVELNEVRQRMSVVLQGSLPFTCGLFFSLNAYENIAFALRQRKAWPEERIYEQAMSYLGLVGLRDRAGAMPDQLSAGMCKRVAIARSLALEAEIVIIDDFDSGIDGVRLSLLCETLLELQRETGATFFVSTHSMRSARRLADHAVVIHEGEVVSSGPAEETLDSTEPLVRQLVTGATAGPIKLRNV